MNGAQVLEPSDHMMESTACCSKCQCIRAMHACAGEASTSGRDANQAADDEKKAAPAGLDTTGNVGTDALLAVPASKTKLKRKAHLDEKKKLKRLRSQVCSVFAAA